MNLTIDSKAFDLVGNGKATVRIVIAKLKAVVDFVMSCPLSFINRCCQDFVYSD